jgi:hypothetical protein
MPFGNAIAESRRDMPKIARRFNARPFGTEKEQVPKGRLNTQKKNP